MRIKKWAGQLVSMKRYLSGRAKKYHDVTDPKNRIAMLIDHLRWIWREREFNHHYYSMGLNSRGKNVADFLGRRSLTWYRNSYADLLRNNFSGDETGSEDILIKDKFYCSAILRAGGIGTIDTLFLFTNGNCHPITGTGTLSDLPEGDYFLKNTVMESGYGITGFAVKDGEILLGDGRPGLPATQAITQKGRWIVQKKISSHPSIQAVNGSALNTTRIYTIVTVNGIDYMGGYQAFATGSSETDSWQHGSVYVSIDPINNRLGRYGITSQSDPHDGVIFQHPDSKIVFEGYEIPFIADSVALCLKAHSFFDRAFVIGWDIAITAHGPMVVEANENPGINVLQCLEGGISRRVKEAYGEMRMKHHD